jgi:hypothetical protein
LSQAALKGDLGRFQPAEVLQFLRLAQATGRLELSRLATGAAGREDAEETVDVFFVGGRPVFARTSGQSVRTGEILVHRGHATHEAVVGALEAQRRGAGKRIGEMLAERNAVAPALVVQAVHECVRRILYGMLLWGEGRFRFFADERAQDGDLPLDLDLDLDRLILEGLRLADQARAAR